MSSKQDLVGARTAADIERRYNFSKRFSEVMGIASDAQQTADEAKQAASEAVGKLDETLTSEEIFNRLTNNGEAQGIYRENGQIYINASYITAGIIDAAVVQVVNLVAEKVSSILENREMRIDGASLRLFQDGGQLFGVSTEYDNHAVLRLNQTANGLSALEASAESVQFTDLSGVIPKTLAFFGVENGEGVLNIDRINGQKVEWEMNSDGTYSLVGRD